MKRAFVPCLAAAALLASGGALAQSAGVLTWKVVGNPKTHLHGAYPKKAVEMKVKGKVALDCALRRNGTLGPCEILSEAPNSYGFEQAAKKIAGSIRLNPNQGTRLGDIVAMTAFFEIDGSTYVVKPTLTKSSRTALTVPTA